MNTDRLQEVLGKNVLYQTLGRRFTGRARIPAQDHDYIVVTPTGSEHSDVVHLSDVIAIIA